MKTTNRLNRILTLTVTALALAVGLPAHATSAYWMFNGSGPWATTGNWAANADGTGTITTVPGAGDTATFNYSGFNNNVTATLAGALSLGSIVVNNTGTTGIKTDGVADKTITLSGGITMNSGAGQVDIGVNGSNTKVYFSLGAAQSWINNSGSLLNIPGANGAGSLNLNTYQLTLGGSGNITLAGYIGGSGSLVKTGAGTLTLNGVSSFSGGLTIKAGTVVGSGGTGLGGSGGNGAVTLGDATANANATLQGASAQTFPNPLTVANVASAQLTIAGNSSSGNTTEFSGLCTLNNASTNLTLSVLNSGAFLKMSGKVTGSGGLFLAGPGTVKLVPATASDFTGGVILNAGTLRLDAASCLGGSAGTFTINGGTIDVTSSPGSYANANNNPLKINGDFTFTGTGTVNLGTGAATLGTAAGTIRTITANASTLTIGGIIGNGTTANALTKAGVGTLALNGANSYTGDTTISAGTLTLGSGGSIASANVIANGTFNVSSVSGGYHLTTGKTLKGTGTVTGPVTVDSGATITVAGSTGTTMGTLTVNGNLTLAGTTTLRLNKGGATTSDLITKSSGTLAFGGTLSLNSVGTTLAAGDQFTIFATGGTGSFSSISPAAPGAGLNWDTSSLNSSGIIKVVTASGTGSVTATPSAFPSAVSTTYGTASSSTSVSISGSGLSQDITASAPTGLEVSSDGSTFGTTATYTQSGGTVSGTLYARLKNNAAAGSYNSQNVVLSGAASPVNVATTSSGNTVSQKALTIASASAANKNYDGNNTATVTGTLQASENFGTGNSSDGKPYTGDSLTVTCTGSTFANIGPGTGIAVTAGTFGVTGAAAGNYTVTQPSLSLSADITLVRRVKNSSSANLNQTTSWVGSVVPGSSEAAVWDDQFGASLTLNYPGGNMAIGGIICSNNMGNDYTIGGGGTVTIGGAGIDMSIANRNFTIAATPNQLGASQTWNVSSGRTLTVNNTLDFGGNALNLTGAGTVVFGNAFTGTGAWTIGAGITTKFNSGAFPANSITVNSGGVLDLNGINATPSSATIQLNGTGISSGGALVNNNSGSPAIIGTPVVTLQSSSSVGGSGNLTVSTAIGGTGTGLTKVGGGTLTLNAGNGYSGGTTVSAGTLTIGGSINSSTPINVNGGTLSTTGADKLNNSAAVTVAGGTMTIGGDDTVGTVSLTSGSITGSSTLTGASYALESGSISAKLGGSAALTKTTAGTATLSGANTYTGNTIISAGTLALSGVGSIANSPIIGIANAAILNVSGLTTTFTLGGSQTLTNLGAGAIINGTNNTGSGTVSLLYDGANPSFIVTNGGMTLSSSTIFKVNNTGAALGAGTYLIISNITAGTAGLVAGTAPSVTLSGNTFANTTAALLINSSGLNLVIKTNQTIVFGSGTSLTKTYGDAIFADTATASSGLTVAYYSSDNAVATVDGSGNVTIVGAGNCSLIATNAGNGTYNPAFVSQSLTVNKATSTITYGSTSFTYNGSAQTPTITFSGSTGAKTTNYVGTGATTYSSVNAPANAGTYYVSNTVAADANYFGATNSQSFTIGAKAASVTADAKTKTYGDVNPALTATEAGTVNGDVLNYTLATDAAQFSSVGVSNITVTLGSNPNYSVLTTNSTLTIGSRAASVTADAKSKTYGDVNPALTAVTNGAVNGDVINVTLTTDATQFSSVGVSNITVTALSNPNYTVLTTNSTLTISQASTSVGATSTNNPSGYKDAVAFTATLPAFASGDVVFSSTNGAFSTNAISSGSANSLSVTNLPRGTNVITVAYLGDGNYIGSTNTLNQIVTNHPPSANLMTVTRTAGLALIIKLSDIATNWCDVDDDSMKLAGVTMQSTNGINLFALNWSTNLDGSIVTSNAYAFIGYTNSPNVNDQISYSISDGQGGTNLGYISIVIQGSVTGTNSITGHDFSSPYSNTVTAYGIPYFYYTLERSTNLTSPVWVDVSTNQAATNGVINAVDTFWDLGGVKPSPSAFYQLKWQP